MPDRVSKSPQSKKPKPLLAEVTDMTFDREVLQSELPCVVDFWGSGCHPCAVVGQILENFAEQYSDRMKFVKINTDYCQEKAAEFGLRAIPTVLFFRQGKLLFQVQGYQQPEHFHQLIRKTLMAASNTES